MASVVIISAAILSGVLQTVAGFGGSVVLMLFLPYFFNMVTAPALASSICIPITLTLAWRFRKYVDFRKIILPTIAYLFCSFWAIRVVTDVDLNLLTIIFGIFLLLLSGYFLIFSKQINLPATPVSAILCGVISGVSAGLFGISGPLMAIYFLHTTKSKEEYSGTLQALFTITALFNLCVRISQGLYTLDLVPITLVGFAAIIFGEWIGLKIVKRINIELMKKLVYVFIGISGAITLLKCV